MILRGTPDNFAMPVFPSYGIVSRKTDTTAVPHGTGFVPILALTAKALVSHCVLVPSSRLTAYGLQCVVIVDGVSVGNIVVESLVGITGIDNRIYMYRLLYDLITEDVLAIDVAEQVSFAKSFEIDFQQHTTDDFTCFYDLIYYPIE